MCLLSNVMPILAVRDIESALRYYDAYRDEIEDWIAFDTANTDEAL